MKLRAEDITPALMIINEEYWIHYVLRDLLKTFAEVIVLDTGSQDRTLEVIRDTINGGGTLRLLRANYNGDANKIGAGRNLLREKVQTHWMFLIDGDEIWREQQLLRIFDFDVPDDTGVVMVGAKQVQDVEGKLKIRTNDLANRDGLFAPEIRWTKVDYPFESYGLGDAFPMSRVKYLPAPECFNYHMRHTRRSSFDAMTYFRIEKKGYFPYKGPFEDPPPNWLGELCQQCPNPYLF